MTLEIIDIHPHIISEDTTRYPPAPLRGLQSDWSKERPQNFEKLVAEMDAAGVAKAAIVQASTYYGFDNAYVTDSVAANPKRFTGVGSIDLFADDAVQTLEGWLRKGIEGIRLFTGGTTHSIQASWLDDPKTFPVWEYCSDKGVSICIQTSPEGLPQVHNLLKRFTKVPVLIDHLARPKLDDGPPYEAAKTLWELTPYENLVLKVTPRTFALVKTGKASAETFFPKLVAEFGSRRLAFGSNLPANEGPMSALVEDGKQCLACLSQADQEAIWAGTAKRIYPSLA